MNEFKASGIFFLLFVLRCVLPIAFVLGFGYLMNWLAARWQRQDELNAIVKKTRFCDAYTRFGLKCWSARMAEEGALPAACVDCPIYKQAITAVA